MNCVAEDILNIQLTDEILYEVYIPFVNCMFLALQKNNLRMTQINCPMWA